MVGCVREYDIGAAWDCGCAFFVRLSMILVGFAFIWACPAGCMFRPYTLGKVGGDCFRRCQSEVDDMSGYK